MSKSVSKVVPRDVPYLIKIFRNFLLGRKHTSGLRNAQYLAKRTQPFPNLPLGPCNKLHDNYYYCSRDARGEVDYPTEIFGPQIGKQNLLQDVRDETTLKNKSGASAIHRTPGKAYRWD